ncbi:hypothetical protein COJ85_02420 [Bacillus sp. AFS076308]|uniref:hypothetical protein n=1 Tax=unclassified Bacillus (in: firmicutes) TaxID=185979 RepID=UPI000BF38708|nr:MULTISPECIES: hypothetical protein [unclassified Bacillus (in: firmicutes)]PFO08976.1 hypothetical protein COJ85_02420 [Bacillus sp. AFS076308]PGV52493.1 hypothetical protein COD92_09850 [Bacillus sp. AFS037270]
MEKGQANFLIGQIERANPITFEIKKLETEAGMLPKFHQWTNGKQILAAYEVIRPEIDSGYYFLFIDWHRNDNYYLVIYAHDKSTTCAEIRQIQELEEGSHLVWSYKPFKRDGKNDQRKAYFKQMFGSTTVHIKLPSSSAGVEDFIRQLFKLCKNRIKADKITEVFDFEN